MTTNNNFSNQDQQIAELKALLVGFLKTEKTFEECSRYTFAQDDQLKLALKELILDEKVQFNGSNYCAN